MSSDNLPVNDLVKKSIVTGTAILALGAGAVGADLGSTSKSEMQNKFDNAPAIQAKYKVKDATLEMRTIKNATLDAYKHEPKDEIKVVVGDEKSATFEPKVKMERWNEVNFSIKPKDISGLTESVEMTDKIKWSKGNMEVEFVDTEDGYKYIWYLKSKPATNKVEFDIETTGLDFFYQPPLNQENTDPNLTCTETQCKDVDGNVVVERPENVVGSYAVYHSTKGGMNDIGGKDYKVGKAFHIFRPHIIDAEGKETWGILHIENGIYSVEIPQEFLDKAVYPILSNDTFGYTSSGASSQTVGQNMLYAGNYTSGASAGNGDNLKMYVNSQSGTINIKGVLLNSSLNIVSNGVGNAVNIDTSESLETSVFGTSPSISASTSYWLGITSDTSSAVFKCDSTGGSSGMDFSNSYSSPANVGTWDFTGSNKFSIYATYTPSGGGAAPSPTQDIFIFD